jgi:hypothetical protein
MDFAPYLKCSSAVCLQHRHSQAEAGSSEAGKHTVRICWLRVLLPCRHQWYQLGSKVVVDVYAKNLPKDAVAVQLEGSDNDKLRITIKAQPGSSSSGGQQQPPAAAAAAAGDEDYVLELDLFEKVAGEPPVKVEVLRTKVEITMVKVRECGVLHGREGEVAGTEFVLVVWGHGIVVYCDLASAATRILLPVEEGHTHAHL